MLALSFVCTAVPLCLGFGAWCLRPPASVHTLCMRRRGSQPPFPAQLPEQRVVALPAGGPSPLPSWLPACRAGSLVCTRGWLSSCCRHVAGLHCLSQPPIAVPQLLCVSLCPHDAGKPALLALPGPNPSNDNSAAVVAFQVGGWQLIRVEACLARIASLLADCGSSGGGGLPGVESANRCQASYSSRLRGYTRAAHPAAMHSAATCTAKAAWLATLAAADWA